MPTLEYKMTKFQSIFWHRRDLRFGDNIGLFEASKNSKSLIGVYVLDPNLLNLNRTTSEAKNWFLAESLLELKKNWERRGSRLLILNGDPIKLIYKLADLIKAECIYWNENIEPYEIDRDKKITEEDVKKAHAKIQKKIHPDVSPETTRLSSLVNEAKEIVLKDIT